MSPQSFAMPSCHCWIQSWKDCIDKSRGAVVFTVWTREIDKLYTVQSQLPIGQGYAVRHSDVKPHQALKSGPPMGQIGPRSTESASAIESKCTAKSQILDEVLKSCQCGASNRQYAQLKLDLIPPQYDSMLCFQSATVCSVFRVPQYDSMLCVQSASHSLSLAGQIWFGISYPLTYFWQIWLVPWGWARIL